jgi:hypothetical protein
MTISVQHIQSCSTYDLTSPQGQQVHIPILMFADDIVLIGLNAIQLQQLLGVLSPFCAEHDMLVSDAKT